MTYLFPEAPGDTFPDGTYVFPRFTISGGVVTNNGNVGFYSSSLQNIAVPGVIPGSLPTGTGITAFGYGSANNLSTGINDTFLGNGAGSILTTGSNNTFLGYNTQPVANNTAQAVGVGSGTVSANNAIAMGYIVTAATAGDIVIGGGQATDPGGAARILIGSNAQLAPLFADNVIGIGYSNQNVGALTNSVTIGFGNIARSNYTVMVGSNITTSSALFDNHIGIGTNIEILGFNAIGIGWGFDIIGDNKTVISNATFTQMTGLSMNDPQYTLDLGNADGTCALRLQTSTVAPTAPANAGDILFFSNNAVPSILAPDNVTTTIASFETFTPGTFGFATLAIDALGRTTITSEGSDTIDSVGPSGNFFLGRNAGNDTLTGVVNVGAVFGALTSLTTGNNNIMIGANSGSAIDTGSTNIGYGHLALSSLTDGDNNVAVGTGVFAGLMSGTPNQNTGVGSQIGSSMASGSNNLFAGFRAGFSRAQYNSCTFLGAFTEAASSGLTNSTALGEAAIVTQSHQVMLGTVNEFVAMPGGQTVSVNPQTVNYSVQINDYLIGCDSTGNLILITLPTASADNTGQVYVVKDQGGAANANNITIDVTGGGNIDGSATAVINQAYGLLEFYSNGTQWYIK